MLWNRLLATKLGNWKHTNYRVRLGIMAGTLGLLTTSEVSHLTGIPEGTLRSWRFEHSGPPSFKIGTKKVVYRRQAVLEWIEEQEHEADNGQH